MEDRRGFTLVELLVVAVLGALILVATYNVLITNQRTATLNTARMQGQQTVRAGADLLFSELREVSPQGGDIVRMKADSITIRVMRASGLLCDTVSGVVAGNPPWRVVNLGDTLREGDDVWLYAEHEPSTAADDVWFASTVSQIRGHTDCGGRKGQEVLFSGGGMPPAADTPTTGSLVRSFVTYTYALGTYGGLPYLVRIPEGGTAVPLVGPLRAGNGLTLQYLDANGNVTAVPSDVRQILVTLRTEHEARNAQGNRVLDSLMARIHTRN